MHDFDPWIEMFFNAYVLKFVYLNLNDITFPFSECYHGQSRNIQTNRTVSIILDYGTLQFIEYLNLEIRYR